MNAEEKLILIKKAAETIRQIDIDRNREKMEVYTDIKKQLNVGVKSPSKVVLIETYLWECVMLGLRSYEYSIEKILKEDVCGKD
jgi:hypothetical protein